MTGTLINSNTSISIITPECLLKQIILSLSIPDLTEKIINRRIINQEAMKLGIKVTQEELQKVADLIRLNSQLEDAQATWEWLEKNCLNIEDFEEIVRHTVIVEKLLAHLFTDDKIASYFYDKRLNYSGAAIREIILDCPDEAIELYYEIDEGEITYFEAAQEYIKDPELRRQGGYLGKVKRTEMKPEVSAMVFASNPPSLLKPIITSKGVHLIQVEEIIEPKLDNQLRHQITLELFSGWLKQKTKSYTISYDFGKLESRN